MRAISQAMSEQSPALTPPPKPLKQPKPPEPDSSPLSQPSDSLSTKSNCELPSTRAYDYDIDTKDGTIKGSVILVDDDGIQQSNTFVLSAESLTFMCKDSSLLGSIFRSAHSIDIPLQDTIAK